MPPLHIRGVVLPGNEERELYVVGDRITFDRIGGAETIIPGGWLAPGLVDVHTHPGAKEPGDPLDDVLLRRHGEEYRNSGVTLLRAPGAAGRLPRWFGEDIVLPRVCSPGPWLASPDGFFAGWGRRVSLEELPNAAVEEATASGGWCKIIADWGRGEGPDRDYQPTVPEHVLCEVVRRVHAVGGRVAVHSQHEAGCVAAVTARADSLEHGMHLPMDLLGQMAAQGTVLVPTMVAFSTVPQRLRDRPSDSERWRRWLLSGFERHPELVRCANEAGVTVLAGTDGPPGHIADEVMWLVKSGIPAEDALGAASWMARSWLGLPGIAEGAPADIVCFDKDPREDSETLRQPTRVILRGRVVL